MNIASRLTGRIATTCLLLALGACGGGGGDDATAPPATTTTIGAAGGTVAGPGGAGVSIPAGALAAETPIAIEATSAGAPALPDGVVAAGQTFALTPHGTAFAQAVTVTLPFDPALVPAGSTPALFKTDAQNLAWEPVAGAVFGTNSVTAQISGFSFVAVVIPPLQRNDPLRIWEFEVFPSDGSAAVTVPGGGIQSGGIVEVISEFGGAPLDKPIVGTTETLPSDEVANGYVFSSADGVTYAVGAESPSVSVDGVSLRGSKTRLKQLQSFVKRSGDATLTFTVTKVVLEAEDYGSRGDASSQIRSEVLLSVGAYRTSGDYFYYTAGRASVRGREALFVPSAQDESFSRSPLWTMEQFDFTTRDVSYALESSSGTTIGSCPGRLAELKLKAPRRYTVDLSQVAVGEEFTLRIDTFAETDNPRGGAFGDCEAAAARAFLRDPQEIGGTTVTTTGLEATNRPLLPEPPEQTLVEPAACVPGPGPDAAAGVLQFGAAGFTVDESANTGQTILVSRTGGSSGAVTATFSTSDGTAVAGTDYTPLTMTVFFADGDVGQRLVSVPIIGNNVRGSADKTVNLSLTQPGNCAALGPQTTAVLTIRDDDPLPRFTVGGTVSGLVGSGLVLQDLTFLPITPGNGAFAFALPTTSGSAYAVTIISQPTNPLQVCSVVNGSGTVTDANVTNVVVECATPAPSGGLDPAFGDGSGTGKVTTAFGGDETAMALQPDGKIILVGGSGSDFVLARYNIDGSLDASFGTGGLVTTDISGGAADEAHGVALQPDGKIVVAGFATLGRTSNNLSNLDFALARYNPDGSLDASFGSGGKVTTDFNAASDRGFAVAVQPDGRIVVAGDVAVPTATGVATDFGLARYNPDGSLDASFGTGGKLATDIAGGSDLARNVVLLPGGALVVSGPVTAAGDPGLDHAGVARYNPDGSLDAGFGAAGKLMLPDLRVGEALALQTDGKLVLGGSVNAGVFPTASGQFAVLRLNADGSRDAGFGGGGLAAIAISTQDDFGRAVAVDAAGNILIAGQSSNRSNPDFAVARFTAAGALDTAFGTGGKLSIDFFGAFDGAENVAVQPDGRIVLGGFAVNVRTTGYALVRVAP